MLVHWSIYDRGQEFVEQVYHGIDFAFIDKDVGPVSHQIIDTPVCSSEAVYKAPLSLADCFDTLQRKPKRIKLLCLTSSVPDSIMWLGRGQH